MPTRNTAFQGLLAAVILASGVATPLCGADETASQTDDTVNVRINLPDGSVVVQKSKRQSSRIKLNTPKSKRAARRLADGSRVSVGSTSGSARTSGARSMTRAARAERRGASQRGTVGAQSTSSRDTSGSGTPDMQSTTDQAEGALNVPTIGNAQHNGDGAFGGQTVRFKDVGMYGAVIGQTLHLVGVEFVQVDRAFSVVRGTRIGEDSAIMDNVFMDSVHDESRFNQSEGILLEFESGDVVTVEMYSDSDDDGTGGRIRRTWTVRIR